MCFPFQMSSLMSKAYKIDDRKGGGLSFSRDLALELGVQTYINEITKEYWNLSALYFKPREFK